MLRITVLRASLAALVITFVACSSSPTAPDAGLAASSGSTSAGSPSSTGSSGGSRTGASSGNSTGGIGACLTGCGSGSGGSSGTAGTSGGASTSAGSSGGTSGCAGANGDCTLVNCCAGLSCDLNTNSCVLPGPDAGTSCGLQGDGGSCVELADCAPPLVCDLTTGSCAPPGPAPSLQCSSTGHACGAGQPPCCGGPCTDGTCAPRTACAILAAPCATTFDCCAGLTCDLGDGGPGVGTDGGGADSGTDAGPLEGTCVPACQGELQPCQTNADCCTAQGLFCLDTTSGTLCYPELPAQPFDSSTDSPIPCAGPCTSFECQLGASCQIFADSTTGAVIDPCAQAGLVCDGTTAVCREPGEFDACRPGGSICQPIADSSVTNLQCVAVSLLTGDPDVCVQPCSSTSDCVDPLTTCQQDGAQGHFCFYSICQEYFGACASSGTADGLCIPYLDGASTLGLCEQSAFSGGQTGSACLSGGNRQVGGLCDVRDFCVDGLCSSVCNAGSGGAPFCGGSPDAGPSVDAGGPACVAILGQTGQTDDLGSCSPACDFTSDAGGGCLAPDGGAPEKCLPQFLFGLADLPTGICVLGPPSDLAVGQACPSSATPDACVPGALCIFDGLVGAYCAQLCDLPDATPGGCPNGQSCFGFVSSGIESSSTGYCATQLPDGGLSFN